jgi:hypothetical protein
MYNDVDMVWLADPFPYIVGSHDVYFMDDMIDVCIIVAFVTRAVGGVPDDDVSIVGAGEATRSFTCAAAARQEGPAIHLQLYDLPAANTRGKAADEEVDRGAQGAALVEESEIK